MAVILAVITMNAILGTVQTVKATASLDSLKQMSAPTAKVVRDGQVVQLPGREVTVGDVVVLEAGDSICADGRLLECASLKCAESALTGESLPVEKDLADIDGDVPLGDRKNMVFSGCFVTYGRARFLVTSTGMHTEMGRIAALLKSTEEKKTPLQVSLDQFGRKLSIGILVICALLFAVSVFLRGENVMNAFLFAVALAVAAIPEALSSIVTIVLSFGTQKMAREHAIIRKLQAVEGLGSVSVICSDKTGTLTKGVFDVTGIYPGQGFTEEELLEYAAYAESYSSHPISKSLKNAYGKELDASNVSDVEEISGHGVTAKVNGRQVAAGNAKLMKSLNLVYTENTGVGTVVHVAVDGKYAGYILISDVIKDGAKEAIASLKNSGVKKCVMLTGDSKTVAEHVAGELKLDEVHSELLPADKVSCVEKLLQEKGAKEKLAFVGDGINDAPVLSRADIGIAMGALGSDAAIEAADVVLMDDNPAKIALAMRISRKCLRIVYENIVFALAVKAICLILGALGIANMWVAIFADVGVMVLAVLNAIRCLRIKNN